MIIFQIGHFWSALDSFQMIRLKQWGFIRHSEISRHQMFQTINQDFQQSMQKKHLSRSFRGTLSGVNWFAFFLVQNYTRQKLKLSTEAFLSKSNIEILIIYLKIETPTISTVNPLHY